MKGKIIKPTPFGSVAIIWSRFDGSPKIVRVLLSTPEVSAEDQVPRLYPDSRASSCAEIDAVAAAIRAFLEGENVVFPLDVVHMKLCPSFQKTVLRAEHRIPWGSVSTYRLIAEHLGKKNGARAVGNALASNPFPLIVPCHRAIRSDGHLGGFQGGLDMKRALLRKEGIAFDNAGRVVSTRFHYEKKASHQISNRS
jgi:methylated-DNA-[protein]-cysteine S-methyltransferase